MIAPKPKAFPIAPSAPWLATAMQSCIGILAINWLCQGMRGMDGKELSFRLLLEVAVWLLVFAGLAAAGAGSATAAIIGLPAAHSFSFLVNGQLWVCVRYCRFYDRDPRALERFLDRATVTLRRCPWLEEALCIGSQGDGAGADPAFRHRSPPDLPAWSCRLGPDEPAAATAARLGPLCPHSARPLRLQLAGLAQEISPERATARPG